MITVDEAQKIVLEHCKTIGHQIETVSFKQALHRVLAVDIKAKDPLPPFPGKILVCAVNFRFKEGFWEQQKTSLNRKSSVNQTHHLS